MSPLKTTRYGVSARRPKMERIGVGRTRLQHGCPRVGIRYETDVLAALRVRSHSAHESASVLKPWNPLWAN
ncbi:hypothetical protein [Burkholderia sp. lig30]|uniref:hypothetical protein n=1 Tax=Burkholderia sp. lig30 TaxID=1192124 RepID=UPI0009F8A6C3|nr:hypothetical protein [Burkholderia sp. lig30]